MKLSRCYLFLLCFSICLIAWNKLSEPIKTHPARTNKSGVLNADEDWFIPSPASDQFTPAAEDVLVQKIRGDNYHLLIMSFYSKENFSGPSITIKYNGSKLTLKDDGEGDDKTAGDGLFTAKTFADVNAFRTHAVILNNEFKNSGSKYFHFSNRAIILDPDRTESFDVQKFDKGQAVSITSLSAVNNTVLDSLKSHSLFITSLKVVEDPLRTWNSCSQTGNIYGAWSFGGLMKQLASITPDKPATDKQVSDFVLNLFNHWQTAQIINGDTVPKRSNTKITIIDPWLEKSRAEGLPPNQLDMKFAPFKLLAIVNRFDKRNGPLNEPAGEARFIFTLISGDCSDKKNYTIAFEYKINVPDNCDSLHEWAQQWYNLKNLQVGGSIYNQALQAITDKFTLCGSNPLGLNQSCFSTMRTNDQALTSNKPPIFGEFREFILDGNTHQLKENTVENVAADRYNAQIDDPDVRRFVAFLNENQKAILAGQLLIPPTYHDTPLQGAKTRIYGGISVGEPPAPFHWDGSEPKSKLPSYIRNDEVRHLISLNACSGCHAGETQTHFWQVDPVFFGTETKLSGFLSGTAGSGGAIDFDNNAANDSMTVKDAANRPANNPAMYVYNDLLRRAIDLNDFVTNSCGSVLRIRDDLMFKPLYMVH